MAVRSRVVAIPFALKFRMFADSTSTYKYDDLDLPELAGLLPQAESMQLQWLLDDVATNEIDWNVDFFAGWDRDHELTSLPFFGSGATPSDQTTSGPGMSAITNISASTHYMQHARLQLKWRLHTGVSVPKEATFSGVLYVTLKGQ